MAVPANQSAGILALATIFLPTSASLRLSVLHPSLIHFHHVRALLPCRLSRLVDSSIHGRINAHLKEPLATGAADCRI